MIDATTSIVDTALGSIVNKAEVFWFVSALKHFRFAKQQPCLLWHRRKQTASSLRVSIIPHIRKTELATTAPLHRPPAAPTRTPQITMSIQGEITKTTTKIHCTA